MKLMIVDDNEKFRRRLASIISSSMSVKIVGQAVDVQGAITCFIKTKPNIIILDIQIINGSGLDVLQVVKETDPATIVIMLTVGSANEYKSKCLMMGADYFFEKSKGIGAMMSLLMKLIQKPKTRQVQRNRKKR